MQKNGMKCDIGDVPMIQGRDGTVLTEEIDFRGGRTDYFSQLFSTENEREKL